MTVVQHSSVGVPTGTTHDLYNTVQWVYLQALHITVVCNTVQWVYLQALHITVVQHSSVGVPTGTTHNCCTTQFSGCTYRHYT